MKKSNLEKFHDQKFDQIAEGELLSDQKLQKEFLDFAHSVGISRCDIWFMRKFQNKSEFEKEFLDFAHSVGISRCDIWFMRKFQNKSEFEIMNLIFEKAKAQGKEFKPTST